MGILKVNDLLVRSHLGIDNNMKDQSQYLKINMEISYNSIIEEESDDPLDAFNIQQLVNEISGRAENSHFNLLEAFTRMVLNTILEFERVEKASVEVCKSGGMEGAQFISFVLSGANR